jgi:hypothetical protein
MSEDLNPVIRALEARVAELEAERHQRRHGGLVSRGLVLVRSMGDG